MLFAMSSRISFISTGPAQQASYLERKQALFNPAPNGKSTMQPVFQKVNYEQNLAFQGSLVKLLTIRYTLERASSKMAEDRVSLTGLNWRNLSAALMREFRSCMHMTIAVQAKR